MRIVLLHHGVLPVRGYGGTERVVVWLIRGLATLGHEVTLIAGTGSKVPEARLIPVDPRLAVKPGFDVRPHLPPGVDLVHAHQPVGPTGPPTLWTMHGNPRQGKRYPPNMVGVSADHARRIGAASHVYNGLDPAEYTYRDRKGDYDLFIGRLHTAKGWQWAVQGARRTGRRLVVAGGWRPSFRRHLEFVGEVDGEQKMGLLAEAACLWMPARWDEPFGLTLIEALVSGTPVLGTRRGALPEVITSDTGALGDTLDDLVALRPTLDALSPEAGRARVLRHFTHLVMAEEYCRLYRALMAGDPLPSGRLGTAS